MSAFLGPLGLDGRVPPRQQTRVAAFLMSAHGALARRLAAALPANLRFVWQTALHAQFYREAEIVSLLMRATSWTLDPALPMLAMNWEGAWVPTPADGATDCGQGLLIDMAAVGHALHAAIRPAALLPTDAGLQDPFAIALRSIEFESGRIMQAQIQFLKGDELVPVRDAVSMAVDRRHRQVRGLWSAMLNGIGVQYGPSSTA